MRTKSFSFSFTLTTLAIGGLALVSAPSAMGNTLIGPSVNNGDFSNGDANWDASTSNGPSTPDFTNGDVRTDWADNGGAKPKFTVENTGDFTDELQSGAGDTFSINASYDLTLPAAPQDPPSGQGGANHGLNVKLTYDKSGGGVVDVIDITGNFAYEHGTQTINFQSNDVTLPSNFDGWDSNLSKVQFAFESKDDSFDSGTVTLDNVNVTEIIPEPASLALLGVGGLMILPRRRNR